ncbi:MAG: AAA family ATPase, partial [Bacteroidales bacterium]|nr:AAA family ATPase [Bacteroidales bacterium]
MNIKDRLSYTNRIISLLGKGEAVVLTGHRRAGKSCILECLADKLKGSGNVMYLDMENPDNRDVDTDEKLNIWIKEHASDNNRNIVLIDEVQEIRDFEKTLRYWVKQSGFDVVVTGSNAKMLSSDVASAFSGRYMQVHVFSLDYGEFLDFNGITSSAEALAMYLKWGGLPFLSNIPADDTRTRN